MSNTLLTGLLSPLKVLADTMPVTFEELPGKVDEIWQSAWAGQEGQDGDGTDRRIEIAKAVLEVVAKEMIVGPLLEGTVS